MNSFKDFYDRPVLGINEIINIDGLGQVKAKVDSGNEGYNVLHGVDIKQSSGKVTFKTNITNSSTCVYIISCMCS